MLLFFTSSIEHKFYMKITINLVVDTNDPEDMRKLMTVIESLGINSQSPRMSLMPHNYEQDSTPHSPIHGEDESVLYSHIDPLTCKQAWKACSWEIIALAVAVIKVRDGCNQKGTFAFFKTLRAEGNKTLCGPLTDRSISSRVGRTAVICKKLGNFRLMRVGVRRKDDIRRVYVTPQAEKILRNLLDTEWKMGLEGYLQENDLEPFSHFER
jgi:hypothetical protein